MTAINQLQKELKALAFEKKQILTHLAIVDKKIATLNNAIDVLLQQENIEQYNTPHFTYRKRQWIFSIKTMPHIISIMKTASEKGFTIAELTQRLFDIEGNPNKPSQKHLDSVRKTLNKLYTRGWIIRIEVSRNLVYWQWKQ